MSNHLRSWISPIAPMVAILAMAMASPARANLDIWASTSNNPPTSANQIASDGGTGIINGFSTTVGSFSITSLSASTNSSGTLSIGDTSGTGLTITNNSSSTATLYITVGATGFTLPVAPPTQTMLSSVGGSTKSGSADNALTFQSYLDTTNGQNTMGTSANFITTGAQNPNITTAGSYNNSVKTTIASLASGYSMTEYFAITLGSNGSVGFNSNTQLTPNPEPSTMALAGLGALGLVGYAVRRRKARTA